MFYPFTCGTSNGQRDNAEIEKVEEEPNGVRTLPTIGATGMLRVCMEKMFGKQTVPATKLYYGVAELGIV